jgi:hypothetical protein
MGFWLDGRFIRFGGISAATSSAGQREIASVAQLAPAVAVYRTSDPN